MWILVLGMLGGVGCILPPHVTLPPHTTCLAQSRALNLSCEFFNSTGLDILDFGSWKREEASVSEVMGVNFDTGQNLNFINVSITINNFSDLDSTLFIVQYNLSMEPTHCWKVRPISRPSITTQLPVRVQVDMLPVDADYKDAYVIKRSSLFTGPKCIEAESRKCDIFRNSILKLEPKSFERKVVLTISTGEPLSLTVKLTYGACNISCGGVTNHCPINYISQTSFDHRKHEIIFPDLKPLFYCARISLIQNECCENICTETQELKSIGKLEGLTYNLSLTKIYLISSFAFVFLLAITFWILRKHFKGTKYRCFYLTMDSRDIEVNQKKWYDSEEEFRRDIKADRTGEVVEVLLLYCMESETFIQLMSSFRTCLTQFVGKVWDPFDESEIDQVSSNPSAWLLKIINKKGLKILLVESEMAVEKQRQLIEEQPSLNNQHYLDLVFSKALVCLHNNPSLCMSYQNLFIIRFKFSSSSNQFSNIVSCTRYRLPEQVQSLLADITGSNRLEKLIHQKVVLESAIDQYERNRDSIGKLNMT